MNETDYKEINFNGVIYVRKDCIPETKPVNTEGMPYVICRGHECGVHAGYGYGSGSGSGYGYG